MLAKLYSLFNDIGGITGVFEWLKVGKPVWIGDWFAHTQSLLADSLLGKPAFSMLVQRRKRCGVFSLVSRNLNLSKELPEMADHAGDMFKGLIGDVSKWAEKVERVRINSVVHPGLRGTDALAASVLADSLHLLVVLCLLEECGVREQASERVQFSDRAYRLRRDLLTVL